MPAPVARAHCAHSDAIQQAARWLSDTSLVQATLRRVGQCRPAALAVVAALLALGVATAFLLVLSADRGPLGQAHSDDEGYNTYGGPVLRNQFFDAALETVALGGSSPAVLDSIAPLHSKQAVGLKLRYASFANAPGGTDRGWPPRGVMRPVRGTVVEPGQHARIWVGGASATVGSWSIRGFILRYHIGRRHYADTIYEGIDVRVVRICSYCT